MIAEFSSIMFDLTMEYVRLWILLDRFIKLFEVMLVQGIIITHENKIFTSCK
nr:Uncharacterised protein [Klebsiella pneumoniae]